MSGDAWLTLAVIAATVFLLVRDLVAPSVAVLGAVVLLMIADVLTPSEALAGFSNPAPFTVAALFVVARAVEKTGALQPLVASTLGGGSGGHRSGLARLMFPSAAASAFLNNTPIVAMLVPQVSSWSERRGKSASAFLMPLSFAAILGGIVTLLGTSTNVLVSGLMEEAGLEPLGVFEIGKLGLPIALAGLLLLIGLAPVLLQARTAARRDLSEDVRQFVVDMEVLVGGPVDGASVEAGGLRHLQGVFLVQVERDGELIAPVGPDTLLHGGDLLRFVGKADEVIDLQNTRGLISAESEHLEFDTSRRAFFEAVVGAASPLVGKTLKESEFRSRYQSAVVAVHRSGQRIDAKLGEVRLRVGDTLLLFSDTGFRARWYDRNDFLLVSPLDATAPVRGPRAGWVGVVIAAIVVVAATGALSLLEASLVGAFALIATGILTPGEARRAVDLDVVVLIAAALGLGTAARVSGLAQEIADLFLEGFGDQGTTGALLGVVLATIVLTEVVTNTAAAALIFPIATTTAIGLGEDPRGFAIAVAIAASASFLTPIGYQTNTMVYGPGGYRFGDYARLGWPLTALVAIATALFVPVLWSP